MSFRSLGRFVLTLAVCCLLFATPSSAAEWGNLTGRFVLSGAAPTPAKLNITKDTAFCGKHNLVDESLLVGSDGGVANIVLYVRDRGVAVHPDLEAELPAEVTLDNKNCRFEPHVAALWIGKQSLALLNSDPVGHNSNLQPIGDVGINPLLPAGGEIKHAFNRKQNIPVPVSCNIHPWMTAYVLPRDNPYTAVTAADGTFKLEKLPAGELEFQAWHEKSGYVATGDWERGRFTMTIQPGENDLGVIKLDLKLFQK